jgi:hypothetical protein
MTDLLRWTTIQVSRRRFLKRATILTFGTFAGASATLGRAQFALACPEDCTAPGPGCACYSGNCNGAACQDSPGMCCSFVYGFCGVGASCWAYDENGHFCCDCLCRECPGGSIQYYCYCHT